MDIRINEVQSRVQTMDSQALLEPQVMRQIVKACVKAVQEDQARQKHLAGERQLNSGASSKSE